MSLLQIFRRDSPVRLQRERQAIQDEIRELEFLVRSNRVPAERAKKRIAKIEARQAELKKRAEALRNG